MEEDRHGTFSSSSSDKKSRKSSTSSSSSSEVERSGDQQLPSVPPVVEEHVVPDPTAASEDTETKENAETLTTPTKDVPEDGVKTESKVEDEDSDEINLETAEPDEQQFRSDIQRQHTPLTLTVSGPDDLDHPRVILTVDRPTAPPVIKNTPKPAIIPAAMEEIHLHPNGDQSSLKKKPSIRGEILQKT